MTTFQGDEIVLLQNFKSLLDTYFNQKKHRLCAHNGKEFDFPYIARRMIIHRIVLPEILQISGKKTLGNITFRYFRVMEIWRL